jgi:epoxyqueuosine reductase
LSAAELKQNLIRYAHSLGFERVGITSAEPLQKNEEFLKKWIAEGRAGEMDYMERDPERRSRPATLLPGAQSVIALARNYASPQPSRNEPGLGALEKEDVSPMSPSGRGRRSTGEAKFAEGRVSRYAGGRDYHKVMGKKLDAFTRYLEALAPGSQCRSFVDTGPLLERAFAQRAGLGFIGKNTMLITKGLGSWVFLASVITTLELPHDAPDDRSCGSCRLCIDACPTEAITAPFTLDARRCIAYLTIEQEGSIDPDLRGKMQGWIFGCDICQEVCPHNAVRPASPGLRPPSPIGRGVGGEALSLAEILSIRTEDQFRDQFAGTAFLRAGRHGLVRNACVAAAHLERRDLIPQLEKLSRQDPHVVVRDHAAWALQRLRPVPLP